MSLWLATLHNAVIASDAARAAGDARSARRSVDELEARIDRVMLVCEAMWSLLRDKLGMSETELLDRVNDLDLSDGKLDGKVRRTGHKCPACGRVIGPRFPICMYCGQAVQHHPFA